MVLDAATQRVVIVGAARVGKTTLARRIRQPGVPLYDETGFASATPDGNWVICAQEIRQVPLALRQTAIEIYAFRGLDPVRGRLWDRDRIGA